MLARLNQVNDVTIHSVFDDAFQTYGNIVKGYDFYEITEYMEKQTTIPENGNVYVASVEEMEQIPVVKDIEDYFYGSMPIQIGYCNGRNTTYNGFEYHKGSEINIAVTDFMLVLGHTWLSAEDGTYRVEDAEVFFVPKGTNTPLSGKPETATGEEKLLLQRNKWVIAHKDREPLIRQGAFPGLIGENKELKY